uniref:C2H2-type domain-containing protein n=1 Tax=Sander lucioperca TaxID=283035 RepID=A0A8C9X053_SANLU
TLNTLVSYYFFILCPSRAPTAAGSQQETDAFMLTPTHEESNHNEPEPKSDHQLFSDNSQVADSQDHKGSKHVDSGSSRNAEPEQNERHPKSNSDGINVNDPNLSKIHWNTHIRETFFECDFCGKTFKLKCHLYEHLRVHTGEKPYSCEMCGKVFRRSTELTVHMKSHTGRNPYSCNTCGKNSHR